jgi:hypothetical protein
MQLEDRSFNDPPHQFNPDLSRRAHCLWSSASKYSGSLCTD